MNWKTLFHDFRGQMSWGRVTSLIALVVAVYLQVWKEIQPGNLKVWLEVAVGSYGASKLVEAVSRFGGKNESSDGVSKP